GCGEKQSSPRSKDSPKFGDECFSRRDVFEGLKRGYQVESRAFEGESRAVGPQEYPPWAPISMRRGQQGPLLQVDTKQYTGLSLRKYFRTEASPARDVQDGRPRCELLREYIPATVLPPPR